MNFRELMDVLDEIWDRHNHQALSYPGCAHQFRPEAWRVKICTSDGGFGALPGVHIAGVFEGIDWDANTILIHTEEPIWQETSDVPIYKVEHSIGAVKYVACPICDKRVGKTDNFCKYCGKAFTKEIKKEGN